VATPVATSIQTTYTVQANDTLSSIAAEFYDDQLLWPQIYEANINLIGANPNVLVAGTVLVIPEK
jgi:nucleoid-associated protein YgaU